jgi:hypothetical protein
MVSTEANAGARSASPTAPRAERVALAFSVMGLVLCAVLAFGLVTPDLGPWHWYGFVRVHHLGGFAIIIGCFGPPFAGLGAILGWMAIRREIKWEASTRLARTAVTIGILGIALAILGLAGNLLLPGLLHETQAQPWW